MTFREYTRRVDNFVANTTAPTWRLAGRLVEKLTGDAWEHCETLGSSSELQQWDAVEKLMRHLKGRFEMIENLRVGREFDDFIYEFTRPRGCEIREYDSLFRKHLARVESIVGPFNPVTKAHVFLRKA